MSIDLAPIENDTSASLRELAYGRLRDAIMEGRVAAGSRINERDLATSLNVSTTPIKDALRRLESDGLVITLPRRGTFVVTLDPEGTHELVLLRVALEGVAARLAAERLAADEPTRFPHLLDQMALLTKGNRGSLLVEVNESFHAEIHRLSRSPRVTKLIKSLNVHDRMTRQRVLSQREELERAYAEHSAIARAILRKDAGAAEEAMRQHVLRTAQFLQELGTGL